MLTRKEDIEEIEVIENNSEIYAFTNPGALKKACRNHKPDLIATFIDQINSKDNKLLYERHGVVYSYGDQNNSILFAALEKNYNAYKQRYRYLNSAFQGGSGIFSEDYVYKSKYGERYRTKSVSDEKTGTEEFEDKRTEEERRDTELSLRIILQREIERVAKENQDFGPEEIAEKILDDHFQNTHMSPLHALAESGPACGDIRVIIDELGVENIPFDLSYHSSYVEKYPNSRKYTPMLAAANGGNFKMLEIYLTEYFKMKYEGGENESLYKEIKNFLTRHRLPLEDVIHMLPKNIAAAQEVAQQELQQKHGDEFDPQQLNREINKFEEKVMPDIYNAQLAKRRTRRNYAIGWSFSVIGAPIAWIWYAVKRAQEPISARKTSVGVYEQYLARKDKTFELPSIDSDESISESKEPEEMRILKRIREKDPVKEKAIKEGKPLEWRTHKVVRLSDDNNKVTVFCNRFNDQASKFAREIRSAERTARRG